MAIRNKENNLDELKALSNCDLFHMNPVDVMCINFTDYDEIWEEVLEKFCEFHGYSNEDYDEEDFDVQVAYYFLDDYIQVDILNQFCWRVVEKEYIQSVYFGFDEKIYNIADLDSIDCNWDSLVEELKTGGSIPLYFVFKEKYELDESFLIKFSRGVPPFKVILNMNGFFLQQNYYDGDYQDYGYLVDHNDYYIDVNNPSIKSIGLSKEQIFSCASSTNNLV